LREYDDIYDFGVKEVIAGNVKLEVAWTMLAWLQQVAAGDLAIEFCVLKRIAGTMHFLGFTPEPLGKRIDGSKNLDFIKWERDELFYEAFKSIRDLPIVPEMKRVAFGLIDGKHHAKWIAPKGYYEWLDAIPDDERVTKSASRCNNPSAYPCEHKARPTRGPRKPRRTLQPA
jgi:hypothetical protein